MTDWSTYMHVSLQQACCVFLAISTVTACSNKNTPDNSFGPEAATTSSASPSATTPSTNPTTTYTPEEQAVLDAIVQFDECADQAQKNPAAAHQILKPCMEEPGYNVFASRLIQWHMKDEVVQGPSPKHRWYGKPQISGDSAQVKDCADETGLNRINHATGKVIYEGKSHDSVTYFLVKVGNSWKLSDVSSADDAKAFCK